MLFRSGKPFNIHKAGSAHWYDVSVGTSGVKISIALINKDSYISVELYIFDNKALFDKLFEERKEIENQLGFEMEWLRLEKSKASRILYKIKGLNFDDHSNYNELIEEAIDKAVKMREVFKKRLK